MKLVCFPALDEPRIVRLRAAVPHWTVVNCADETTAADASVDADCYFGKMTPAVLSASRKLRWIQSPTASLEHYLFDELIDHASQVTNMRGIYSDVIADHVMAYVLCFARNFHLYFAQQREALWKPVGGKVDAGQNFMTGPGIVSPADRAHLHLSDCTLGVVGLGGIGAETARRASSFGMHVLAVDPQRTDKPEGVAELGSLDLLEPLLEASDFVVIAAPHTPQTAQLFDRARLRKMKRSAYLINIGRGAIVVLDDLTAALQAGEIAGAGLDVFEQEPLPSDHPLWRMPNVLITPHIAACSPRIAERHFGVLLDNVKRFDRSEPLANVVDKRAWF